MEFHRVTSSSPIDHFEGEVPAFDADVLAREADEVPDFMDEVLAYDSEEVLADADEAVVLTANTLSPMLTADNSPIIAAFLTGLPDGQQPWDLLANSAKAPLLETSLDDNYSEDEKIIGVFFDSSHPSYGNTTHYSWQHNHTFSLADAQKAASTPISLTNVPDRSIFPSVQTPIVQACTPTRLSCLAVVEVAIFGAYSLNSCSLAYKPNILMVDACTSHIRLQLPSNRVDSFPSTKADDQVFTPSFGILLTISNEFIMSSILPIRPQDNACSHYLCLLNNRLCSLTPHAEEQLNHGLGRTPDTCHLVIMSSFTYLLADFPSSIGGECKILPQLFTDTLSNHNPLNAKVLHLQCYQTYYSLVLGIHYVPTVLLFPLVGNHSHPNVTHITNADPPYQASHLRSLLHIFWRPNFKIKTYIVTTCFLIGLFLP
ncbi:hypothetical protein KP509_06G090500 [Ceratopteris richardii]|uniref:Uncharacterized protein n=1 Tax=Ceratopteris richardii TaxID=49495 RepID=A0A8T2UR33_CERRI|nr:hypothetical protein KP509_06G090500 [Ceratopteris richardii]